jgi:protein TonB
MRRALLILICCLSTLGVKSQSADQKNSFVDPIEQQPQFPGGYDKLQQYLKANLKRPAIPVPGKGRVILTFIVEKDGRLTDIRVVRVLGKDFDDEALRVMKNSPKWTPASQNNITMRVTYTLPISFVTN